MRWIAPLLVMTMTLPQIAQSQQAPVPALPIAGQWTTFRDPEEQAFALEVPEGWQVQGGTGRRSSLQYRPWVQAAAPDANTIIALNDPGELSFAVPTQSLAMAGYYPGTVYTTPGAQYTVASYLNGKQYAEWWGKRRLAAFCQNINAEGAAGLPELTAAANGAAQAGGMSFDAGMVTFSCTRNGVPMRADALAVVRAAAGQLGALWWAEWVGGFVTPEPLAGVAAGTMRHMIQSTQVNPVWVAQQTGINFDVSNYVARTNSAISNSIMQRWAERGAVMDRIMAEGSRARLGIDIYRNPATGTQYTVPNTYAYYWVNPSGTVAGTNTDSAPNGFTRLSRVPP